MHWRKFLFTAAAAGTVRGANERVRGAIIGSGGRGRLPTGEFKEIGVEMAAVCDVNKPNLEAGLKAPSSGAKAYADCRERSGDKSLNVVVAPPDHWHAQMTIDAVHAGKDVYVEKPTAHTPDEGFRIIDAVRKTKRVVQVGMQRRSFPLFQEANKLMAEGEIDWKAWLGTAPKRDTDPARFFNWNYYWGSSGGLMIGQAAHIVDSLHWFMNSKIPSAVVGGGVHGGL